MSNAVSNITLLTIAAGAAAVIIWVYIYNKYLNSENTKHKPQK